MKSSPNFNCYIKEIHKWHALLYSTNKESMVNMPKQNGRKNKIKMDSYDVHVYPIQFQLYDKESF